MKEAGDARQDASGMDPRPCFPFPEAHNKDLVEGSRTAGAQVSGMPIDAGERRLAYWRKDSWDGRRSAAR